MKYLLVLLALVGVGSGQTLLNLCEENDSRCTCIPPNVSPGSLEKKVDPITGDFCYCTCGQILDDLCEADGECIKGTYCGAPSHFDTHTDKAKGVCTDVCKRLDCPNYHSCSVNSTGSPVCTPSTFNCTTSVHQEVCAADTISQTVVPFRNMCFFMNAQFDRTDKGEPLYRETSCVAQLPVVNL